MTGPRHDTIFVATDILDQTKNTTESLARERSGESPPSGHFRRDEPGDVPPIKNLPYNP